MHCAPPDCAEWLRCRVQSQEIPQALQRLAQKRRCQLQPLRLLEAPPGKPAEAWGAAEKGSVSQQGLGAGVPIAFMPPSMPVL